MKHLFISILFILPFMALSQQKPAGWLTPYADARFENGKIIYSVTNAQQSMNFRLLPLMYPRNLVQLRFDNRSAPVNEKYVAESRDKIRDYLNTEPNTLRSANEQEEYLRLSVMVLLWDLKLSDFNKKEVQRLKTGDDKTISKEADIVLQILTIFEENKKH